MIIIESINILEVKGDRYDIAAMRPDSTVKTIRTRSAEFDNPKIRHERINTVVECIKGEVYHIDDQEIIIGMTSLAGRVLGIPLGRISTLEQEVRELNRNIESMGLAKVKLNKKIAAYERKFWFKLDRKLSSYMDALRDFSS